MLSVSILEMYAQQFETLVRISKRTPKTNAANNKVAASSDEANKRNKKPLFNWFAGPTNVFLALNETGSSFESNE